jgi:hypothetical protein
MPYWCKGYIQHAICGLELEVGPLGLEVTAAMPKPWV